MHLCSLQDDEVAQLIATSQHLMRRAYETGGFAQVFLPPALRQATGKLGYVYGRSGQICLRCGGTIAMIRQGEMQRMSFSVRSASLSTLPPHKRIRIP